MNLPDILNVAIGLVLLFFLLSTLASLVVEFLTVIARYREEILQITVQRLLLGGPDQPWRIGTLLYDRAVAWVVPNVKALEGVRAKLRPDDDIARYVGDEREQKLLRRFWNHPKIRSLVPNDAQAPAALAADVFAEVVVEIAVPRNSQGELPDNRLALDRALAADAAGLPDNLKGTLRGLLQATSIPAGAAGDGLWKPFRAGLAAWYEEASKQATAIYREKTKRLLLVVGALLALALNADTVRAARVLAQDGSLREATATYAATLVAENSKSTQGDANRDLKQTRQELSETIGHLREVEGLGFPLGWTETEWKALWGESPTGVPAQSVATGTKADPKAPKPEESDGGGISRNLLFKLVGLLATALAVAQGGPFWYDLMQKLIGLRKGAGGETEPKKDAPAPGAPAAAADGKATPPSTLPLEIGHDLTAPAAGFSARKAYWLARASAAAYLPETEVAALVKQDWLFPEFQFFEKDGAQAFVAADERIVLVAFRGTELSDVRDALADLKIKLVPWAETGPGRVHTGFLESYELLVKAGLENKVAALLADDRPRQLYLTGHSLGGGMATVMFARRAAAWSAAKAKGPEVKAPALPTLYTFGCPRVGDAEFALKLDKLYPGRVFRVENTVDVVPEVPPGPVYHHVGQRLHFNEAGKLEVGISGLSLILGEIQAAVTKDNFKDVAQAKVEAHAVAHYIARCEAEAGRAPVAVA